MVHQTILQISELSQKDLFKIPYTISNKVLMAPGVWNGVKYSAEDIKKAFENTDWNNKDIVSLIADHADKPLSINDWLGWIVKPRLIGDNIIGDLELYDEDTIVKLALAKAKFGISPRVKGIEDPENHEFKNFIFENFSVVTNPAVKKAYINLSEKLKGGKMTEKILQEETISEQENEELETEESIEEDLDKEEELSQKKILKKKKYPYPKEEKCKKKKYPEEEEEEMSDEDLLEVTINSDWTDFVARMRKKYPKMSLKDIAKAFKAKSKEDSELEEMTEEDLISRIEKLTNILRRKKKYPETEEDMKEKKINELSQKITEMEKRLNEPDPKSIMTQELSDKTSMTTTHASGVKGFAEFLQQEFLK